MKKVSITIKAAIISAIIPTIGAIILFIIPLVNIKNTETVHIGFQKQNNAIIKGMLTYSYINNVRKLTGLNDLKISDPQIMRFDYIGDHKLDEYIFSFFTKEGEYYHYYGVVSTRDEKNELIMYGSDFIGSITNLVPFFYNDDPYLLMYNAGGNANYVNLEFYKYDGFSLPKKTWEVTSLANGYYYFNASQFMFVGNNHRFKTIYNNGNFEINRYTNRYENGFSNTSHVLKFDLTPNMKISYDNMQIVFFEDKNEGLINQIPINIKHDEIMVIDDNVNENNRYIRMLTTYGDGIEFKQGFFDKAIFTKIGEKKIRVDDTYKWYNIKFLVK